MSESSERSPILEALMEAIRAANLDPADQSTKNQLGLAMWHLGAIRSVVDRVLAPKENPPSHRECLHALWEIQDLLGGE